MYIYFFFLNFKSVISTTPPSAMRTFRTTLYTKTGSKKNWYFITILNFFFSHLVHYYYSILLYYLYLCVYILYDYSLCEIHDSDEAEKKTQYVFVLIRVYPVHPPWKKKVMYSCCRGM